MKDIVGLESLRGGGGGGFLHALRIKLGSLPLKSKSSSRVTVCSNKMGGHLAFGN